MGLKANAEKLVRERLVPRRCRAITLADALPEDERDYYLQDLLPDAATYSGSEVQNLLSREGVNVATSTITDHRAGRCRCDR